LNYIFFAINIFIALRKYLMDPSKEPLEEDQTLYDEYANLKEDLQVFNESLKC